MIRSGGKVEDAWKIPDTDETKINNWEDVVKGFLHDGGIYDEVQSHREDQNWLHKLLCQVGDIIESHAYCQQAQDSEITSWARAQHSEFAAWARAQHSEFAVWAWAKSEFAAWPSEVEKVWQPGNLVARKFLKNQALAESFFDPSPALSHKQK